MEGVIFNCPNRRCSLFLYHCLVKEWLYNFHFRKQNLILWIKSVFIEIALIGRGHIYCPNRRCLMFLYHSQVKEWLYNFHFRKQNLIHLSKSVFKKNYPYEKGSPFIVPIGGVYCFCITVQSRSGHTIFISEIKI